ncbi:MAG TPA: hypothetical protein IAC33_09470 [Candidatus Fimousia stercorigallinarum]|nr:hypothetical protein [Candidatus Fimousia stercorigallinarum]
MEKIKSEIYSILEYLYIHVFGKDNLVIQCSGEDPLIAQNMGATFIISRSGIAVLSGLCIILN